MANEQNLKMIPYGVADFNSFRVKNYYYVDKTRFIRNIEEKGDFLFLIRPRRFGKSLFLGILESYYDIAFKDHFDFFFNGTEIYKNPTNEKNNYMILKLNFSLVYPDIQALENSFLNYIKESTSDFITKYAIQLNIDVEKAVKEVISRETPSDVMVTFLKYCKRKEHKLYVIIDEYDNFANTIIAEAGDLEFRKITHGQGFLRAFFNVLKGGTTDTDAPISRLFMTGVSPITLDDVTSGFNIATNISLDSDLNEIMGFTVEEVETMIDYYRQTGKIKHSTPELLEIMSRWYNHYRFSLYSTPHVFNTVHVLYFLKEYMKNSLIPIEMIDRNIRIDYQKLKHLIVIDQKGTPTINGNFSRLCQIIENNSIHSRIVKGFPIDELIDTENFTSLLYYFGLLTIDGLDEENKAILKIPNESIRRLYYDYIKDAYENTGIFSLKLTAYESLVKEMAFNGDWEPLIEFLAARIDESLGLRDLITGEKSIQAMLNVYLGLSSLYLISSEKELNKGYADLLMEPFLAQFPAIKFSYIIEIKYIKPTDYKKSGTRSNLIQQLKEEAESQLIQYSKDKKLKEITGSTTLKKLVLIFAGTKLVYHHQLP